MISMYSLVDFTGRPGVGVETDTAESIALPGADLHHQVSWRVGTFGGHQWGLSHGHGHPAEGSNLGPIPPADSSV